MNVSAHVVDSKIYTIRRGDTLSRIASFFGITLQDLLDQNPQITNPNLILVGDKILIPDEDRGESIHRHMANENVAIEGPEWFRIALREEGVTEVGGSGNNPRILEYHATTSLDRKMARQDRTAWCSSFVNWCMKQAGIRGTGSAWALDWANWGRPLEEPRPGCVVVFSRTPRSGDPGGHVGFFLDEDRSRINILGGNQSDKVGRQRYPRDGMLGNDHYRLKAYRWPGDL